MVRNKYNNNLLFYLTIIIISLLDQISKLIINYISPNLDFRLLSIHLVINKGAGFGILQNQMLLLSMISLIVFISIIYYHHNNKFTKKYTLLLGLFNGGVLGNLVDRIFRGMVIDFIDFKWWPTFNLADACITIATIGIIIYNLKKLD